MPYSTRLVLGEPVIRKSRLLICLIACLVCALLAFPSDTQAQAAETKDAPSLSEARSAIIIDSEGQEIWGTNEDDHLASASITKVMTAMVVLDTNPDMDSTFTCQKITLESGASIAGYQEGDTPTLRELFSAMLVYSANDAAEELALATYGSRDAFVDAMNQKAQELGMDNTHFVNPTGLKEDNHYSSARDLVTMGRYALTNYPLIAQTVKQASVKVTVTTTRGHKKTKQTRTLRSSDTLLNSVPGMLGIKTGAVEDETTFLGACQRGSTRIYTCVMGCKTRQGRFNDTKTLIDWTYSTDHQRTFIVPGVRIATVRDANIVGWIQDVVAVAPASGYVWPNHGDITSEKSHAVDVSIAVPGSLYQTTQWKQGDRQAAEMLFITANPHPKTAADTGIPICFPIERNIVHEWRY